MIVVVVVVVVVVVFIFVVVVVVVVVDVPVQRLSPQFMIPPNLASQTNATSAADLCERIKKYFFKVHSQCLRTM